MKLIRAFLNWLMALFVKPLPTSTILYTNHTKETQYLPIQRRQRNENHVPYLQIQAMYEQGNGYATIPCEAPAGYFWKRDLHGTRYRLYQDPAAKRVSFKGNI